MTRKEFEVYKVLNELSIQYDEYKHPPVFTVEQAEEHWKDIRATHCKNIFLRDKKGRNHLLVVLRFDKQLDISKIGEISGLGRLSFASEQRLERYLGLAPGSVSPFGLINDKENLVEVYIDNDLIDVEKVGFHPNDNSITITITYQDFKKYLDWTGNEYKFIEI